MVTKKESGPNARFRVARYSAAELAKIAASRKTPAGTAFPVAPPSAEGVRRFVLAGICPFCGRGPWKSIAGHTSHSHGVTAKELRDLAELTYQTPITDPELHAFNVERGKRLGPPPKSSRSGKKKHLSVAGRKRLLASLPTTIHTEDAKARAQQARAEHLKQVTYPCTVCGAPIPAATRRRLTCSSQCRQERRRQVARETAERSSKPAGKTRARTGLRDGSGRFLPNPDKPTREKHSEWMGKAKRDWHGRLLPRETT